MEATISEPRKEKIAILGGGMGSIAAAFENEQAHDACDTVFFSERE